VSLNLYLLRHGQTALSREDVFCGSRLDPELTHDGLEMAQAFAAVYETNSWSAILTSELRRTIHTAAPLCDALGVNAEVHSGLNEIEYGSWEGKTKEEVNRAFHEDYVSWLAEPSWHAPTGGELAVEVARRSLQVVANISERFGDGNVLAVSHKATIRIILCSLLGIDVGRFRYRLGCPVGSVSIVEFTSQGPLLKVMADRSHLNERLRLLPGT
jgi:probable phosphoglycerate mutase